MDRVGTFRLGQRIGTGGMATVFLAVQEGPGGFEKHVAFKRLHEWVLNDERVADSFLKEARLAAALNHPNIVSTLDVGRNEETAFIVMEYLRGETVSYVLSALNGNGAVLPVPVACHVAAQVAAALDYAHTLKGSDGRVAPIVHRDVSPSNIILCYNGMVKLLDFGIATRPDEDGARSGILKGKTDHLAPEQLMGSYGDPRSDVFQLGIVLWEMLTGRRLFGGATDADRMRAVLERDIPAPSKFNEDVAPEIDAIVASALSREPDARCSAAELHERLETATTVQAGAREVRAWLASTFPHRQDHWVQLEQEIAMAPSLTASRTGFVGTAPPTSERSLWLMVAGSSLFATFALALALFAVVYLYQEDTRGNQGIQPVRYVPVEVPVPAAAAQADATVEPDAVIAAPEAEGTERPATQPGPAAARRTAAAVDPPREEREESRGANPDLRPRFEAPAPTPPEPAPAPAEAASEPAASDGWTIDENEEIIDPFATGE